MRSDKSWLAVGLGIALAAVCVATATPAAAQGALAKAKAAKTLVVGISGGNAPDRVDVGEVTSPSGSRSTSARRC